MVVNAQTIKTGLNVAWKGLVKAAPTISVIFGVALMAGATVKTGIEAPKLRDDLDELNDDETLTHNEYMKKKCKVLLYHLGLPAIMMLGGAGFIFGGYKIKYTEAAIATAAFASKSDEVEKIENKVIEKFGQKEYDKMKDEMAKDDVKAHPINFANIINTGHGNTLCYDPVFHDYFLSDLEFIRRQATEANEEMLNKKYRFKRNGAVDYNSWRERLDLPGSRENENDDRDDNVGNIENFGKDIGWINRKIELKITVFKLSDDTVVHVIGFTRPGAPKWHLDVGDQDHSYIETDANGYVMDDETDMPWRG